MVHNLGVRRACVPRLMRRVLGTLPWVSKTAGFGVGWEIMPLVCPDVYFVYARANTLCFGAIFR